MPLNLTEGPHEKMLPDFYAQIKISSIYGSLVNFSSEIFKLGYPVSVTSNV